MYVCMYASRNTRRNLPYYIVVLVVKYNYFKYVTPFTPRPPPVVPTDVRLRLPARPV